MTIFKAELIYFLRSPVMWLIMAVNSFMNGWSFLLAIDLFTKMQVKFAEMSDAPTIIEGIIFPVISAQAKLAMLAVAIVGGLSFARLGTNNGWMLINIQQQYDWSVIMQKYMAHLLVFLIFFTPLILAVFFLMIMAQLPVFPIVMALLGFVLLILWMLALSMCISSMVNNTGFAILLSLVSLVALWLMSQSGLGLEWGKNWLQVFSPMYHFENFMSPYFSLSSIFYFVFGTFILLWTVNIRLFHKRFVLV